MVLAQFRLGLAIGLELNRLAVDGQWTIALNVKLETQQQRSFGELGGYDLRLGSFPAKLWGYFAAIGLVVFVGVS